VNWREPVTHGGQRQIMVDPVFLDLAQRHDLVSVRSSLPCAHAISEGFLVDALERRC
jgi:hypothetical protein